MRLITACILFLFSQGCLPVYVKKPKGELTRVSIGWEILKYEEDGISMIDVKDSVFVYKKQDIFVYNIYHIEQKLAMQIDEVKAEITSKVLSKIAVPTYFIFREGGLLGLKYDSLSQMDAVLFNVDSLLLRKSFKGMNSYNPTNYKFVSKSIKKETGVTLEKYVPYKMVDNSFDSAYFYLTAEKFDTEISFSKLLEEERKMKLYKLELIWNEVPANDKPYTIPRRVMKWEIANVPFNNISIIDTLIERFKKQRQELK